MKSDSNIASVHLPDIKEKLDMLMSSAHPRHLPEKTSAQSKSAVSRVPSLEDILGKSNCVSVMKSSTDSFLTDSLVTEAKTVITASKSTEVEENVACEPARASTLNEGVGTSDEPKSGQFFIAEDEPVILVPSKGATANLRESNENKTAASLISDVDVRTEDEPVTSPLSDAGARNEDVRDVTDGDETEAAELISLDNDETDDAVDSSADGFLDDQPIRKLAAQFPTKDSSVALVNGGLHVDDTDEEETHELSAPGEKKMRLYNGDVAATVGKSVTHAKDSGSEPTKLKLELALGRKRRRSNPSVLNGDVEMDGVTRSETGNPSLQVANSLLIVQPKKENCESEAAGQLSSLPLVCGDPSSRKRKFTVEAAGKATLEISSGRATPELSGETSPEMSTRAFTPENMQSAASPSPPIPPLIKIPQSASESDSNGPINMDRQIIESASNNNGSNNNGSNVCETVARVRKRSGKGTQETKSESNVGTTTTTNTTTSEGAAESLVKLETNCSSLTDNTNCPTNVCQTHQNKQTTKNSRYALTREKTLPTTTTPIAPVYNHIPSWVRGTMSLLQKVIKFRGNKTKGEPDASAWFLAPVDPLEVPGMLFRSP